MAKKRELSPQEIDFIDSMLDEKAEYSVEENDDGITIKNHSEGKKNKKIKKKMDPIKKLRIWFFVIGSIAILIGCGIALSIFYLQEYLGGAKTIDYLTKEKNNGNSEVINAFNEVGMNWVPNFLSIYENKTTIFIAIGVLLLLLVIIFVIIDSKTTNKYNKKEKTNNNKNTTDETNNIIENNDENNNPIEDHEKNEQETQNDEYDEYIDDENDEYVNEKLDKILGEFSIPQNLSNNNIEEDTTDIKKEKENLARQKMLADKNKKRTY